MATITGDADPNVRDDTPEDDGLYGLGGNDTLRTSSGADYVNGGGDDDTLVINWSNATGFVYLGAGYAFVDTGPEQDSYATSKRKVGFDSIERLEVNSGAGNDTLNGLFDVPDKFNGGGGVDYWTDGWASTYEGDLKIDLSGGSASLVDGTTVGFMERAYLGLGAGDDTFKDYNGTGTGLEGFGFDDQVYGGNGNDTLGTSFGSDYLSGQGGGDDLIVVNWVNQPNDIYFAGTAASGSIGIAFVNNGVDGNFSSSTRKVGFDGFERADVTGGFGNDWIIGNSNAADRVNGYTGVDRWTDILSAFTGDLDIDLTVVGGNGRTLADGSHIANIEQVELVLGSGNDRFRDIRYEFGSPGYDDVVRSGAGNDDLGTSGGRDSFFGGDGADVIRINWQSTSRAVFVDAPSGYGFVYTDGATDYGTSAARVTFSDFERLQARGSTANDTLRGFSNAADTFDGGAGNDLWIDDFSTITKALNVDLGKSADGFDGLTLADGTRIFQIDRAQIVLGSGNDKFRDKRNLDDYVEGRGGNDSFRTEGGRDSLHGGDGNDTLAIDWSNSFAKNTVNGLIGKAFVASGGNTFETSTRRVEFSSIEHLNVKTGARPDLLIGTVGADTLDGGVGYDTVDYSAKTAAVEVTLEFAKLVEVKVGGVVEDRIQNIEYVIGGSGADRLTGDTDDNALTGNDGADTLDGGIGGTDLLTGNFGDDVYFIRSIGDKAVEKEFQGTDTVNSAISYTLEGQYVENLVLIGSGAINGTGNKLANVLTGNAKGNVLAGQEGNDTIFGGEGNDTIDGGKGVDRMVGGDGKDRYIVDNVDDEIVEVTGDGTDTVLSSVSYTLGDFVDNLTLIGGADRNGVGNGLKNVIVGNSGDNFLSGLLGNDTLTGGDGKDKFVFDTKLGSSNVDTITDFFAPRDSMRIDNAVFAGLSTGALSGAAFKNIATGTLDATDRILYDSGTGDVFFDRDGSGSGFSAVKFAILGGNPTITAADFLVI